MATFINEREEFGYSLTDAPADQCDYLREEGCLAELVLGFLLLPLTFPEPAGRPPNGGAPSALHGLPDCAAAATSRALDAWPPSPCLALRNWGCARLAHDVGRCRPGQARVSISQLASIERSQANRTRCPICRGRHQQRTCNAAPSAHPIQTRRQAICRTGRDPVSPLR